MGLERNYVDLDNGALIASFLHHKSKERTCNCMKSAEHLKAIQPELERRNILQEALKSDGDIQNEGLEFDDFPAL